MKALALCWSLLMVFGTGSVFADARQDALLQAAAFQQRLGNAVPLATRLTDENGRSVSLARYFDHRPVILDMAYYHCPDLCSVVLEGLAASLKKLHFVAGKDYQVVVVSIDPRETPADAAGMRRRIAGEYNPPGLAEGWHFLTGREKDVKAIADAVGFHYAYDQKRNQYAHAAGIVIATPQGLLSRYLLGVEFPPQDLRFSMVDAGNKTIGSPVDALLLCCYSYDPTTGKYNLAIMNVIRFAGGLTVAAMVLGFMAFRRMDRGKKGA